MITRTYSKAQAVANHVVWTNEETISVPFNVDGLVPNLQEFGIYQVQGRAMYCVGFRADVNVPAQDHRVQLAIGIYTGQGVLAPGSMLYLNGITPGDSKCVLPPIAMPVGSFWKFIVQVASPSDLVTPQGLTVTYQLRYANGPVNSSIAAYQSL